MSKLTWDQIGHRFYETGVDRGVLYIPNSLGAYVNGYAWSGLTGITEKPTGATPTPKYADNLKYLNLISNEYFGGTIDAFTYPDAFAQCDGTASPQAGIAIGQQNRKIFGLSYRTRLGTDVDGTDHAYKLHLVYGALAAPSDKAYTTINDTPEAMAFSWAITATPISVPGYKDTSTLTIDSSQVDPTALATLEGFLYGTTGTDPSLPLPVDVLAMFSGTVTQVTPVAPTFASNVITIPTVTGVAYQINGVTRTGTVTITTNTVVTAVPLTGYKFPDVTDNDWLFTFA